MSKNIMVVAVHPDDETLGCGGTILKHINQNNKVHWMIATNMQEKYGYSKEAIDKRADEINRVKTAYPFESIVQLEIPTTQVDIFSMNELVRMISKPIIEIEPEEIYIPFKGDVHSDHRKIFEAVFSCTKIFRYPYIKKILMMEVLSETEFATSTIDNSFIPNFFVDISTYMDKKLEIMQIYQNELKTIPFPRSIENIKAQGTFRGSMAGCRLAESFMLIKEIW